MYENEREELVRLLYKKGIRDESVLRAMLKVERHQFVSPAMHRFAYTDKAMPIGKDQTISQPYTVAFMTEKLGLKKGSKVLEIGTGSGYQAAVLHAMGMLVFTIERRYELYADVQKLFDKLGIRALVRCGDGTIGWQEFAPYDGIIVTAGGNQVPDSLLGQLAPGGRLVIPIGSSKERQEMVVITADGKGNFSREEFEGFQFVPLIGKEGWEKG